jgi:asparagine synthase (glutamine-hydrolysing)
VLSKGAAQSGGPAADKSRDNANLERRFRGGEAMCGLFGGHSALLVEEPAKILFHRGPDQQGHKTFVDGHGRPFVLGMTRLSIVDRRDMPIPFCTRGATIAFNGEIYNWRDLRSKLQSRGIKFETETDTEVVLHAFLEWGPACLDRFNGMFAIAIWSNRQIFLARDRLGKKPLFYCADGDQFAFASELKAFATLESSEIDICEKLEFYFDEHTPFKHIWSVRPGECVTYDTSLGNIKHATWWRFPDYEGSIDNLDEALSIFIPLFEDACRIRQVADVPVTMFLSGGIDSSLIQAVVKSPTTYTVQFDEFRETIDEESLVKEFSEFAGFEARIIRPSREDFFDVFPYLARFIEFPVGSLSIFPLFCLAKQARADGFKVALSGEGADEFLNGYYRNELLLDEDALIERYLTGSYRHLSNRYFGSRLERMSRMASRDGLNSVNVLKELFAKRWDDTAPFVHNMSHIEATIFLQPLLTMADRMSMGNSLEVRNPFMDVRLVELSAKLAPSLRYGPEGRGKYILREALKRLIGTDYLAITRRPTKHGLPSPVNTWLFRKNTFDRRDWNKIMLGECLRQMSLRCV